jgi:hypothetical protein
MAISINGKFKQVFGIILTSIKPTNMVDGGYAAPSTINIVVDGGDANTTSFVQFYDGGSATEGVSHV